MDGGDLAESSHSLPFSQPLPNAHTSATQPAMQEEPASPQGQTRASQELPPYGAHYCNQLLVTDGDVARAGILPPEVPEGSTLAGLFEMCSAGCGRVRVVLEDPVPKLASVKNEVLEHVQTLLTWGPEHRATWPARTRESLDDRMVHNKRMLKEVREALDQIQKNLHDIADSVGSGSHSPPGYNAVQSPSEIDKFVRLLNEGMKRLSEATKSFWRHYGCLSEYTPEPDPHVVKVDQHYVALRMRAMLGKSVKKEGGTLYLKQNTFRIRWPRFWVLVHPEARVFGELLARANSVRRAIQRHWQMRPYLMQEEPPLGSTVVARAPTEIRHSAPEGTLDYLPERLEILSKVYTHRAFNSDETKRQCNLCRQVLNLDVVMNEESWRRHVYRDLRPYLCTYPRCKDRDLMYETKAEWIAHERRAHRWHYACPGFGCQVRTWEEGDLRAHLRLVHPSKHVPDDLSQFRAVEPYRRSCLLCGKSGLYLEQMEAHYATHLEDIALITQFSYGVIENGHRYRPYTT